MKVITIPYINSEGKLTDYFYDLTNGAKKIVAGTILDVSETRAKQLLGDNKFNIMFAKPFEEVKSNNSLEEMTRDELFELANKLGLKLPKNTKTINLINKIIEKQNS
jgi:Asp-tRNA(Asn)/Glu-tRNA(Gln) amidotransferase B subunit